MPFEEDAAGEWGRGLEAGFGATSVEAILDRSESAASEKLAGMTDAELGATLIAAWDRPGAERVRDLAIHEARGRFQPYARRIGRKYCVRLFHRARRDDCKPDCSTVPLFDDPVLDRIVAKPGVTRRGPETKGTHGPTRGWFVEWARGSFRPFKEPGGDLTSFRRYMSRRTQRGWSAEMLRHWNGERGLVQRLRAGGKVGRALDAKFIRLLEAHESDLRAIIDPWQWPRADEIDEAQGDCGGWGQMWLSAIYDDACQTPHPGQAFDPRRVARALDAKRWTADKTPHGKRLPTDALAYHIEKPGASIAWVRVLSAFDGLLQQKFGATYSGIVKARDVTQSSVADAVETTGRTARAEDEGKSAGQDVAGTDRTDESVIDELFRAQRDRQMNESPEVAAARAAGFAVPDTFLGLGGLVEQAREELPRGASLAEQLGRVLDPARPQLTDEDIELMASLISLLVQLITDGDD